MPSSPATFRAFTDAAAEAVAKAIAAVRREAASAEELRASEFRAFMAEQREATAALHRRLEDALAKVRDGKDGEPGAPGRDGKDAEPVSEQMISAEVARYLAANPPQDGLDGRDGADGRAPTVDELAAAVALHLEASPPERGRDGADASDDQISAAVAAYLDANPIPAGKDGADGRDGVDAEPVSEAAIADAVEAHLAQKPPKDGADGRDGRDGTMPTDEQIAKAVADHLETNPPAPGRDGADAREDQISAAVAQYLEDNPPAPGKDGERGPEGKAGKLPAVREWTDEVQYEGTVVSHEGSTWQAARDTGRAPPHEDWILLAGRGQDGRDGLSFNPRRLWAAADEYHRLDVVALNGGSFVALKDDPGECPGPGWMLLTQQGKRGERGDRGEKGDRGDRGLAADPVVGLKIDDEGMLTLINGDGQTVRCDLYPVLAKIRAA